MPFRLSDRPSAAEVERLASDVSSQRLTTLELDISSFDRARLFGESRLLAFLASIKRQAIPVVLSVGPTLSQRLARRLLNSAAGVVLLEFSTRAIDGASHDHRPELLDRQAALLKESRGLITTGKDSAAIALDRFGHPPIADVFSEDESTFISGLRKLLFINLGLPRPDSKDLDFILRYTFEALQNTRDHACTDLRGRPTEGVRLLSVRRLNLTQEPLSTLLEEQRLEPFHSYIESLRLEMTDEAVADHLVEISVSDSGPGIQARMVGNTSIYAGPLQEEEVCLQRAMSPSGTSKLPSVMGAGLGLYKILQAVHRLKGVVVIRSGRLTMFKHYLGGLPDWPSLKLYSLHSQPCELLAGTTVSFLFPWTATGRWSASHQMQLYDSQ